MAGSNSKAITCGSTESGRFAANLLDVVRVTVDQPTSCPDADTQPDLLLKGTGDAVVSLAIGPVGAN